MIRGAEADRKAENVDVLAGDSRFSQQRAQTGDFSLLTMRSKNLFKTAAIGATLTASLLNAAFAHASAQTLAATEASVVYREHSSAVFLIEVRSESNSIVGVGSAFLIADHRLVTNAHVVRAGTPFLRTGAVALPLTVERLDPEQDLAVLRLDTPLDASPLTLSSSEPAVGTTVFALGNPQGLERSISEGIVSGLRVRDGRRLLQITAAISPGSSGGPVVTADGRVVAVTVGYLEGGQNLNFAIPVESLRALLAQPSTTNGFPGALGAIRAVRESPVPPYGDSAAWNARTVDLRAAFADAAGQASSGRDFLALAVLADSAYETDLTLAYAERAAKREPLLADSARALMLDAWEMKLLFADSADLALAPRVIATADSQIARRPQDAGAYSVRAEALSKIGRARDAITAARRSVEIGRNTESAELFWGRLHRVASTGPTPLVDDSVFREMVKAGQADTYDWSFHAAHLQAREQWERAGDAYVEADRLQGDKHRFGYTCDAGKNYWIAELSDRALSAFRACIESYAFAARVDSSKLAYAHRAIASILTARGVYGQAEAQARQAVALAPQDAWSLLALSEALQKEQRASEAAAAAEESIRLSDGKYAVMHFAAGAAYFDLQDWSRCSRAFAMAAQLNSEESNAPYNAALCLAKQGYYTDAAQTMAQVLVRNPNRKDRAEIQRMINAWRR